MDRGPLRRECRHLAAYLDGHGQFPERLPWLVLVGRFLEEFLVAVDRWSEWAADIVEQWPDDVAEAEPDRATLEMMTARSDEYRARARERSGAP